MTNASPRYTMQLKNEKRAKHEQFAFFLVLLNMTSFIIASVYSLYSSIRNFALIGTFLLLAVTVLHLYFQKKKKHYYLLLAAGLFLAMIVWLMMGVYWVAAIIFILGLLHIIASKTVSIHFYPEEIVFTSIPVRHVSWHELSNVILRDNLLTMDYHNNKLFQAEIYAGSLQERDFNEFCRNKLFQEKTIRE
jgi:hypothetical protein